MKCNVTNNFQEKPKSGISANKSPANITYAVKTNGIYEMKPQDHQKLLIENISKTYHKAPDILEIAIFMEAKKITKAYKLAEKIDHLQEQRLS